MRQGTVCFITDHNNILLISIEYAPNDRKWTGIGGMVDEGESLEDTVVRESKEESYIELDKKNLKKVAELTNPTFQLHVFLADTWTGELKAKEASLKEFKWFSKDNLPWSHMHDGNETWLPLVLNGRLIKSNNNIITEVSNFD